MSFRQPPPSRPPTSSPPAARDAPPSQPPRSSATSPPPSYMVAPYRRTLPPMDEYANAYDSVALGPMHANQRYAQAPPFSARLAPHPKPPPTNAAPPSARSTPATARPTQQPPQPPQTAAAPPPPATAAPQQHVAAAAPAAAGSSPGATALAAPASQPCTQSASLPPKETATAAAPPPSAPRCSSPPTSDALASLRAPANAQQTAAPPVARTAVAQPLSIAAENASSSILQSVHTLQRMPHGTPTNPLLSASRVLPVDPHLSPYAATNRSPSPLQYKREQRATENAADKVYENPSYQQPSPAVPHHAVMSQSQAAPQPPAQLADALNPPAPLNRRRPEYVHTASRAQPMYVAATPAASVPARQPTASPPQQQQQQHLSSAEYVMHDVAHQKEAHGGNKRPPPPPDVAQGARVAVPKPTDPQMQHAYAATASDATQMPPSRVMPHGSTPVQATAPPHVVAAANNMQMDASQHADYRQAQSIRAQPTVKVEAEMASRDAEGEGRRQLKVEDALLYLEKVKAVFGCQPDVYNLFLDIMKAFKAQTIDTTEVIVRVSQLFQGHEALILGFNRFLPPGYKILIGQDEKGGVSTGYEGPKGYRSLHAAQTSLHLKPIAPHPSSAPSESATPGPVAQPVTADSKQNAVAIAATSNTIHPPAGAAVVVQSNNNSQVMLDASHPATPDRLSERANPLPPPPPPPPQPPQSQSPRSPLAPLHHSVISPQPSAIAQDGDVIMVDTVLSPPLPTGTIPGPLDATDEEKTQGFTEALNFLHNLRRNVNNAPLFERFCSLIHTFSTGEKSVKDIYNSISGLFDDRKELLTQFKQFLPLFYNNQSSNGGFNEDSRQTVSTSKRRIKPPKGEVAVFNNIRETLGRSRAHIYNDFIKVVRLFSIEIITKDELLAMISELFKSCPAVNVIFTDYLEAAANDDGHEEDEDEEGEDEEQQPVDVANLTAVDQSRLLHYKTKCVSEIAGESKIFCTNSPSYRGLPKDFPTPTCSGRNAMERATLNNYWVSVTQGSEEYSARFMRKNSYEDNLYRCEDDRYELDMIIETNAATIMKLEPIAATITKLPSEVKAMHALVDGVLNRIHYNCIQRIYGEKGHEVVMQVKLNPYVAVPLVLARLKEKDAHWRRARSDMNRVWRDVGEKNYYRGVDHRSTVFKQVDKKELSLKTLIADIMDPSTSASNRDSELGRARGYTVQTGGCGVVNDRSRAVAAVIKAAASGAPPHRLFLHYEDDTVHRVAFELVKMQVHKDVHESSHSRSTIRTFRKLLTCFYGVHVGSEEDATGGGGGGGGGGTLSKTKDTSDFPVVLYGDDTTYQMFRLYDILYERLSTAKTAAYKMAEDQKRRDSMNEKGQQRVERHTHLPKLDTKAQDLIQSFTPTAAQKYFSVKRLATSGRQLFSEFISMFRTLVTSSRTFNADLYEDKCRMMLGQKSFVVFTLDKLLTKTSSLIAKVCAPELPPRAFIDLFHESRLRMRSAPRLLPPGHWEDYERLHCTAAVAQLRKEKGAGAILFRMQYIRKTGTTSGILCIAACGKASTDDEERVRLAAAAQLDEYLGFSGSADTFMSHRNKKEYGSGATTTTAAAVGSSGGVEADSKEVDRGCKKRKVGVPSTHVVRKRSRMTVKPRPPFRKKCIIADKVRGKSMIINNSLAMNMRRSGVHQFVPGGCDVLMNLGRRWKFDNTFVPNSEALRFAKDEIAQMFIAKTNNDDDVDQDNDEVQLGQRSDIDVKPMDVDRTESSSGSGTHSEVDVVAFKGVTADVPNDDDVAGETCSESSRKDESGEDIGVSSLDVGDDDEEFEMVGSAEKKRKEENKETTRSGSKEIKDSEK